MWSKPGATAFLSTSTSRLCRTSCQNCVDSSAVSKCFPHILGILSVPVLRPPSAASTCTLSHRRSHGISRTLDQDSRSLQLAEIVLSGDHLDAWDGLSLCNINLHFLRPWIQSCWSQCLGAIFYLHLDPYSVLQSLNKIHLHITSWESDNNIKDIMIIYLRFNLST